MAREYALVLTANCKPCKGVRNVVLSPLAVTGMLTIRAVAMLFFQNLGSYSFQKKLKTPKSPNFRFIRLFLEKFGKPKKNPDFRLTATTEN